MIKPLIGRTVHFYRFIDTVTRHVGPLAAKITFEHSDALVNLAVFDQNGRVQPEIDVLLVAKDGDIPADRSYCCWIPNYVYGYSEDYLNKQKTDNE